MLNGFTRAAVIVLALTALAAPAAANAEALVTDSLGQPATSITGLSTNTVWSTPLGNSECTTTHLELALSENSTSTAAGAGTGTAKGTQKTSPPTHTGPCQTASGLPFDIPSIDTEVHLNAEGTSSYSFTTTYVLTLPVLGPLDCTLDGTGDLTWVPGSHTVHASATMSTTSPAPCLEGTLTGDFTLTEEFGLPVELH